MTSATFEEASERSAGFFALLRAGFAAHALPLFLTATAWVVIRIFVDSVPGHRDVDFASFATAFVLVMMPTLFLAVVTVRFAHLALYVRPERPLIALVRDLKSFFTDARRLSTGIPMVISLCLLLESFNRLKYNIPVINPFGWDQAFAELDKWMHFGLHPWEWLQPILGFPFITFLINVNYNLWFIVMWCLWVIFAFAQMPSVLRMRFFLSFILAWTIGGGFAAVMLSSAGPVYYSNIGLAPDPYIPLMDYLRGAGEIWPIWALDTQQMLWDAHTGKQNIVAGISAMPSMHNASSLLFALVAWHLGRKAGIALSVFAFLIFLGSVHLAWHYAVDAYLGWAITLLVWWASGPIARWNQRQPWTRAYIELLDREPARAS